MSQRLSFALRSGNKSSDGFPRFGMFSLAKSLVSTWPNGKFLDKAHLLAFASEMRLDLRSIAVRPETFLGCVYPDESTPQMMVFTGEVQPTGTINGKSMQGIYRFTAIIVLFRRLNEDPVEELVALHVGTD